MSMKCYKVTTCTLEGYILSYGRNFDSELTASLMKKKTQRHRKLQRASSYKSKLQDPSERLAAFKRTNGVGLQTKPISRSSRLLPSSGVSSVDEQPIVFRYVELYAH